MRPLNLILISTLLMMLSSCELKPTRIKFETEIVTFEESDLLGEWIQTNKIEDTGNIIQKITLNKDMTCVIEIIDANKLKIINGNWQTGKPYEMTAKNIKISIKSDIIITYKLDRSHLQKLALSVETFNKQMNLNSHKLKFSK